MLQTIGVIQSASEWGSDRGPRRDGTGHTCACYHCLGAPSLASLLLPTTGNALHNSFSTLSFSVPAVLCPFTSAKAPPSALLSLWPRLHVHLCADCSPLSLTHLLARVSPPVELGCPVSSVLSSKWRNAPAIPRTFKAFQPQAPCIHGPLPHCSLSPVTDVGLCLQTKQE